MFLLLIAPPCCCHCTLLLIAPRCSLHPAAATAPCCTGDDAIKHLLSRGTHQRFNYGVLLTMLGWYFIGAALAAGSAISSGLFVPMLMMGALLGRLVGLATTDIAERWGQHLSGEMGVGWREAGTGGVGKWGQGEWGAGARGQQLSGKGVGCQVGSSTCWCCLGSST